MPSHRLGDVQGHLFEGTGNINAYFIFKKMSHITGEKVVGNNPFKFTAAANFSAIHV